MKELKIFGIFLVVVLMLLTALMAVLAGSYTEVSHDREMMIDMWREVSWFTIPSEEQSHGEDGPIRWRDPGMEAHIRFLLRKPEGEIFKSEVWDIQVLTIMPNYHTDHDSILTKPPQGTDGFDYQTVIGATRYWEYYEGKTFPPIGHLEDLAHFDSLQVLCMDLPPDAPLADLSGLESCRNLKVLQLTNAAPKTLAPLENLQELEYLTLEECGKLDLSPLKGLSELKCLSLEGSQPDSLEPLVSMQALSYLGLDRAELSSLEPLTRSTVEYLSISALPGKPVDHMPLARIPALTALGLSDNSAADAPLCRQILAGCSQLRYLDIYGTPAAAEAETMVAEELIAFVYS